MAKRPVPKKVIVGAKQNYEWFNASQSPKEKKETGFYDASGNRYDGVAVKLKNGECFDAHCNYCNKVVQLWLNKNNEYVCPSCGAQLKVAVDKGQNDKQIRTVLSTWLAVVLSPLVIYSLSGIEFHLPDIPSPTTKPEEVVITDNVGYKSLFRVSDWCYQTGDNGQQDITLEDNGDNSFYDKNKKVRIFYEKNDKSNPWRYYFEEISPNFAGDGLFKFDYDSLSWKVKNENGNWEFVDASQLKEDMYYIANNENNESSLEYLLKFEKKLEYLYDAYSCNSIGKGEILGYWVKRLNKEIGSQDYELVIEEERELINQIKGDLTLLNKKNQECSNEFGLYKEVDGVKIPDLPYGYQITIYESNGGKFVNGISKAFEIRDSYQKVNGEMWRAWGSYDFYFDNYGLEDNFYIDGEDKLEKPLVYKEGKSFGGWETVSEGDIIKKKAIWN